jgi:lipopolysaccharide transport system ATP-binding protein
MSRVIQVENISKVYSLGTITTRSLKDDLSRYVAKLKGKEAEYYSALNEQELIWSLRDISFNVSRGDVLGIIGKNGAGKSTLLKILSRVTAPTTGEIKIKGRVASLLEVGTGFHPELTGKENIFLNGAILGMSKKEIKSKFDEIVEFSGVERFINTPVKRYSSGMYVRLAFAVAAHLDPEILIVDEVLAVGDADFQKKCLGKMQDVSSQGRTVLFVSHNVSAVKNLCTKGLFLEKGKIVPSSSLEQAIELYFGTKTYDSYQKEWNGEAKPGNSSLKVNRVALADVSGKIPDIINISKDLMLNIEFEVIKDNTIPIFSFGVFHANSELVFGSLSNVEKEYGSKKYGPGRYTISCTIPGNTLNNGRFFITINGYSSNYSDHFVMDSPLSFESHDDGNLAGDYKGSFGGYIRPLLKWETKAK